MNSTNHRNQTRRGHSSSYQTTQRRRSGGSSQRLLYDANGVRIKQSRFPLKLKRALLFYVLPYIVINAIIFFLVTATPKVDMSVGDTSDYRTTQVEFKVDSMPLPDIITIWAISAISNEILTTSKGMKFRQWW